MAAQHDPPSTVGAPPHGAMVTSWMTVGEARAALVTSGQRALPVVGHDGLIGLITIEAVSGHDDDAPPDADDPILAVMDWHLVQLPPDADERKVVRTYTDAAWTWMRTRGREVDPPAAVRRDTVGTHLPTWPHRAELTRRRPLWWMG